MADNNGINWKLKFALLEKFGDQSVASRELQIEYCRLSRAIHGWRKLSSEDRKNIERVFGKAKTREFFQYADEAEK